MKKLTQILVASLVGGPAAVGICAAQTYVVVDTGQSNCYDNRSVIAPPKPGQPFYGQDAQLQARPPSYTLSADGLTVHDNNTDLTWQRSPDTDGDGLLTWRDKLTLAQAQALPPKLNAAKFGGFNDWRLPSIKEQFSLFDARGTDPSGIQGSDTSGLRPFLDTNFFKFAYGDTSTGERIIDSQYASSTRYVGLSARGFGKLFGVNFADGRIKGYDLFMPGGGVEKTFFVLCVRGNPNYGKNDFYDNADGTITDRATGLMWSKSDSGQGMNWQDALAWAQKKDAEKLLGHDDWRLPSVKELQSIVDYTRSPDTTHSPAIDSVFNCTTITNEAGQSDYPFYWSATTHAGFLGGGAAMYVAFGRAAGWMSQGAFEGGPPDRRGGPGGQSGFHLLPPLAQEQLNLTANEQRQLAALEAEVKARLGNILTPDQLQRLNQVQPPQRQGGPRGGGRGAGGPIMDGPGMGRPGIGGPPDAGSPGGDAGDYHYVDVHGAGAQRSDPKVGNPAMFPHGRGPQGDVIRIYNYIRLVRVAAK
jgi:hypothetical protein